MCSYTPISDCKQIDLTRHGLIEASAGTGKTYTIENLVLRFLITRPDLLLENLLLVTFTEKAAGELSIRLRQKLEEALRQDTLEKEVRRRLEEALDTFDTAAIHTIHGFCHSVLTDFAFENGSLFEAELVSDHALLMPLLKEQMRKAWPQRYGTHLDSLLQVSGFADNPAAFMERVCRVAASSYRPAWGDRLYPLTSGTDIDAIVGEICRCAEALKEAMGAPPQFSTAYGNLNINARSRSSLLQKIVLPLEEALWPAAEGETDTVSRLAVLVPSFRKVSSAGRTGPGCLLPQKWLKKGANPEACPRLEEVVELLENLSSTADRYACHLLGDSVVQLQEALAEQKRENGWISYSDMLELVAQAVCREPQSPLVERLRRRFRVAFVDEFQDTDAVQWRIFRTLFLAEGGSGPAARLLYVIGDPKQAIYAFRGADVYAYLEARRTMEHLAAKGEAHLYSLAQNWRSSPELVERFNTLFASQAWFAPEDRCSAMEIGYQPVASPPEEDLSLRLAGDASGRSAVTLVDLRPFEKSSAAKEALARFIAVEIRDLMQKGRLELEDGDGHVRALDYGDVAILVRGRPDADRLETSLARRGIPASFYKKPGLFTSMEAVYLHWMLRAIQDPSDGAVVKKAMLTPFFGFSAPATNCWETLPAMHPVRRLFSRWHDLAVERRWGRLFESMMASSGRLFRDAALDGWDREQTDYQQICEHLLQVASLRNLDLHGMILLMEGYMADGGVEGEDADIHQIETEARKVQIMTMHASKGLQFPVVFIGGGLTSATYDTVHQYHREKRDGQGFEKVIDLTRRRNPERHAGEKVDEDRRLFYVALTRARFRLYLPYYPARGRQGWVGPVGRFFATACDDAFKATSSALPVPAAEGDETAGNEGALAAPKGGDGQDKDARDLTSPGPEGPAAVWPCYRDFRRRRIRMESFTGLHRAAEKEVGARQAASVFETGRVEARERDEGFEATLPRPALPATGEPELPGGADVGSMLHEILETIDFRGITRERMDRGETSVLEETAATAMRTWGMDSVWQPAVQRMIVDTLTAPVPLDSGDPFRLNQLALEDRMNEVEFYFPVATATAYGGFVRGFIDLVFRFRGKYYIADWKSNRLENGYSRRHLQVSMDQAGYHLQYRLYTLALLRWMHSFGNDRFDPEKHFGGIFYFYLRGMGRGDGQGIYYVPPDEAGTPKTLEQGLKDLLNGRQSPLADGSNGP